MAVRFGSGCWYPIPRKSSIMRKSETPMPTPTMMRLPKNSSTV
jgi:hypothetical protein